MNILDCTLRDGGYYTNWDFDRFVIDQYIQSMNILPVDYLEIGYRNNLSQEYFGKYAYSPVYELERIRLLSSKKLAIMLNEKSTSSDDLKELIYPISGLIDMVRIAVDPLNFERGLRLAEAIKKCGFEVGFNLMYMSKWKDVSGLMPQLKNLEGIVNLFCMVDSYGGVTPKDVEETILSIRQKTTTPIGFHGHNNVELALINTLTAIENKVDFVDTTVLGMGRGAGNLKTELLLTYLSKFSNADVDFNVLGKIITVFSKLLDKHKWGTNLPYMISGVNSLPQKEVMEWVGNRTYSFNSIIRALENKKKNRIDNVKYPIFKAPKYKNVLIIGGGETAFEHKEGIKEFIKRESDIAIIHATSRNAIHYASVNSAQYLCLVGSEGERLKSLFGVDSYFNGICILPPYPRLMGTDVPSDMEKNTYELSKLDFTDLFTDSCTAVALQASLEMFAENIYIVGYDGYPNGLSQKERDLSAENEYIFGAFVKRFKCNIVSLTPSLYGDLRIESVYQKI